MVGAISADISMLTNKIFETIWRIYVMVSTTSYTLTVIIISESEGVSSIKDASIPGHDRYDDTTGAWRRLKDTFIIRCCELQ